MQRRSSKRYTKPTPSATWQPGTGRLLAPGPVLAVSQGDAASKTRPTPLRLVADSLEGDTISRRFLLKGEVRVADPAQQQSFRGRELSVAWSQRRAVSDQPFRAQRGPLQIEGSRLQVEGESQRLIVEGSCRLTRPGEQLQAGRCIWNWQTGQLDASGGTAGRVLSRFRVPQPRR